MAPQSILIVGAGIAGPALASFLLLSSLPVHDKPRITLLERSSTLRASGQNVDVRGVGATAIRKLGLEGVIRSHTTGEEGARFVNKKNRAWAELPADKTGKRQTATADIEILRSRLGEILFRRLENINDGHKKDGGKGVEFIFGDYVKEIGETGEAVKVTFAKSGAARNFDIVVGADGLQSRTRKMVWGEDDDDDRLRKLHLYSAYFSMPKTETDGAWCRFYNEPGRKLSFIRPSEFKDRTTAVMSVVNTDDKRFPEVCKGRDIEAQRALFIEYWRGGDWECGRLVREVERAEDFYCDEVAQVTMEKWSKGRVVLLGDAGYCGSPISGMGTTFALAGAYHLVGNLLRHSDNHDTAYNEYERMMRPLVTRGQKLPTGVPKTAIPETAWGVLMFHVILWFITMTGLANAFQMLISPDAEDNLGDDYGVQMVEEWLGWEKVLV